MIDTEKLKHTQISPIEYRNELLETLESLQSGNLQYKSVSEWIEAAKLTLDVVRSLYYLDNESG